MDPDRTAFESETPLDRQTVLRVLSIYQEAWETQNPEIILTIFTPEATYQERPFAEPFRGHRGIRCYWETKVLREQAHIQFSLLRLYLDGNTAIAEWEVEFDDLAAQVRRRMREVAILEFQQGRISSLREYWRAICAGKCRS
jgi:ketosteroid isomerase-like protein